MITVRDPIHALNTVEGYLGAITVHKKKNVYYFDFESFQLNDQVSINNGF